MCGIFCSISRRRSIQPSDAVRQHLRSRGPDASNQICITTEKSTQQCRLVLHSTVLSLRGHSTTEQPFRTSHSDSILCWNGEAWTISGKRPAGNDTSAMYDLLCSATSATTDAAHQARAVSKALSAVAGPYAFAFYADSSSRLFFARDLLGRRSLLRKVTSSGDVLLSSIADGSADASWTEVEADGIYCIDLEHDLGRLPQSISKIDRFSSPVHALEEYLYKSLSFRVTDIPEPPQRSRDLFGLARAKLGVLFSGGLDCTTLARMCHDLLDVTEPIDLLNIAFENPRVHKAAGEGAFELCPDRITGRSSYAELCEVCPDREWRFVCVNVPYREFSQHRQQIIALMHPHNTEMDLSIASALYFAARGEGMVASQSIAQDCAYTTSARVLLSGLGADELFAGYTRHATAFNRNGYEGLLDELDLDVARLGKRNLGRDDRVISHWGREARFPFLDEHLVQWALAIPVTDKCDFVHQDPINEQDDVSTIEPGKKILRCLAWKLGMKAVAREKKRAIQFGARTAKMETGGTKGTTLLSL
ncbi:uncharacterized protein MYCFIDRAFT_75429 [Pseudocercospora fijiensis CIRAD86]|uniref:Glutamine amidotransferase type-2 domain-containing protein n=1 Tax=Pseudocercospora fijiensis (strain CIRAD86) TaxID=383855 RepID=N1Q9M2_PSEFD|nr:uncharacterized protein MYCFIDRAFT_75429 [Pseudocercospora fijiensis CIRAD86]EME87587.1 hypothetical protein MYCFIDRAFT_75429 [Pseudocercospora fijiensis CIRAD86]